MTPQERFDAMVERTEGCWYWRGCIERPYGYNQGGYGRCPPSIGDRYAHRAAWKLAHGPIPKGLEVSHSCDVRHCVRPDHLSLKTHAENIAEREARRRTRLPIAVRMAL